jgi:hypothetical protein
MFHWLKLTDEDAKHEQDHPGNYQYFQLSPKEIE